jgi:hypothetical protein
VERVPSRASVDRAYGGSGNQRFVEAVDPLGDHEREETLQPAPVPFSDPANTVPQGIMFV